MSEVMETIVLTDASNYCREVIEEKATEALADARWYASHTMRFLHVTGRNEELFLVESVRRSAEFYRDEWSPNDVSEQARRDYEDALKIVENIERVVREMGAK